MKIKTLFATLLLAGAVGASSFANAEGELDGKWFNTRIKTTVKKNHGLVITGSPPTSVVFNSSPIQFDSGKDACFSALNWHGAGTRIYDLIVICEGTGNFEKIDAIGVESFLDSSIEFDDGSVLFLAIGGSGNSLFGLPAEGQGNSNATQFGVFFGAVILKTSFTGSGALKNAKLIQPVDGSTVYIDTSNPSQQIIGSSGPGLKMKLVDSSLVPAGAKACLASILGGTPVANCAP